MAKDRSKLKRNAWARVRICDTCGKKESVRKDNTATTCLKCTKLRSLKSVVLRCAKCDREFRRYISHVRNGRQYCSADCRNSHRKERRIKRECKRCSDVFDVYPSIVVGPSNSAGNFCSRPCYEAWLCRTETTAVRGSQWRRIQRDAIADNPFCAICGRTDRLQVHHIIPFRLTRDNSQENLVPLCLKHHKRIEMDFIEVEDDISGDLDLAKSVIGAFIRLQQSITRFNVGSANCEAV